ncbi:MAG: B12-binding domain-containing radical SAM protein, partial [Deltaproteobacteria bacterium]|nr:B12-binding domain-containing radical SAM protein [Deltaproteobacteria bacterium]
MRVVLLDVPSNASRISRVHGVIAAEKNRLLVAHLEDRFPSILSCKFPPTLRYNLGLLCISAWVKQRGVEVKYHNAMDGAGMESFSQNVGVAQVIGVTCTTPGLGEAVHWASVAKRVNPDILVVIGGRHVTFEDMSVLRDFPVVDCVVRGEGERVFSNLLDALSDGGKLRDVEGITFRENGRIVRNGPERTAVLLAELPMPDYNVLPGGVGRYGYYLMTTRGCPYSCVFCAERGFWNAVRFRPVTAVLEELRFVYSKAKYNVLHVADDNFFLDAGRACEILHRLKEEFPDIMVTCNSRFEHISDSVLNCMATTNLLSVAFGIESGCETLRSRLSKSSLSNDEIAHVLLNVRRRAPEIILKSYWISGLPGENDASLRSTALFIHELIRKGVMDICDSRGYVPYPGTPPHGSPRDFGISISHRDWSKYDRKSFPCVYRSEMYDEHEMYHVFLYLETEILAAYRQR